MNRWLVKSDPDEYGWEDLVKDRQTDWTGIRNHAARLHLLAMKKGDRVLFYHSGDARSVVGAAKVARAAFRDPTASDPRWVAVALQAGKGFHRPVTLAEIKAEKRLAGIGLVRIGRLSVMPLQPAEYDLMVAMGS